MDERKTESDFDERIKRGRLFQIEGAANEKDRSPNVLVFVRGLQRDRLSEEDRRVLAGGYIEITSERYEL